MLNHDARFRDEVSEEGAHLTHLAEPRSCDGCGEETTLDTIGTREIEGDILCPCCSTRLELAFVRGVFAPSSVRVAL